MKTFTVTEQAAKGIILPFTPGQDNRLLGLPLGEGLKKLLQPLKETTPVSLDWLDVQKGEDGLLVLPEKDGRDQRALVHVTTAAGVGGVVTLHCNQMEEKVDPRTRRVVRSLQSIDAAVGVTVLAEIPGPTGTEYLVSMLAGASFRIARTGRLEGAPSELTVLWGGYWDMPRHQQGARAGASGADLMAHWGLKVHARKQRRG